MCLKRPHNVTDLHDTSMVPSEELARRVKALAFFWPPDFPQANPLQVATCVPARAKRVGRLPIFFLVVISGLSSKLRAALKWWRS